MPPSYHYLVGPAVAVLAVVLLVLLCRWTFSTGGSLVRTVRRPVGPVDYGLLVPAATVTAPEDAQLLRDLLVESGIRATVAASTAPVGLQVLVFRSDLARARSLVGPPAPSG